jgi:hypothetical protein
MAMVAVGGRSGLLDFSPEWHPERSGKNMKRTAEHAIRGMGTKTELEFISLSKL